MKRLALPVAGSLLALATPAAAIERQHHLGVDAGGSLLDISDKSTVDLGGGGGFHYAYGLTDQFNFAAEIAWSLVALGEGGDATTPTTRPASVATGGLGAMYVLDITQVVPYFGLLVGAGYMTGGTISGSKILPDAQLALGADYLLTPKWAVGLAVRQHMFVFDTGTYPSFTNVFLRAEYYWGF